MNIDIKKTFPAFLLLWIFTFSSIGFANTLIYELPGTLFDQHNKKFNLNRYKGKTVLFVVGYSSCPSICPMVTSQLKKLDKWFNDANISSEKIQFVFITIDPKDTADNLLKFAEKNQLDLKRWTLAQTDPAFKDKVVTELGLSFDRSKTQDHMRHSFSIVVTGPNGKILKTYPSAMDLDFNSVGTEIKNWSH